MGLSGIENFRIISKENYIIIEGEGSNKINRKVETTIKISEEETKLKTPENNPQKNKDEDSKLSLNKRKQDENKNKNSWDKKYEKNKNQYTNDNNLNIFSLDKIIYEYTENNTDILFDQYNNMNLEKNLDEKIF